MLSKLGRAVACDIRVTRGAAWAAVGMPTPVLWTGRCRRKAKMSALSKVKLSVSLSFEIRPKTQPKAVVRLGLWW